MILNINKFKRIYKKPRLQIPPDDKFFENFEYLDKDLISNSLKKYSN